MKRFKEALKQVKRLKSRKGFSLIELSIVLIIIGLLLAAVMKGRDLIKSAEIKKFYNNFIKQWELIYTSYYDRTGKILGGPLVVKDGNNKYFEYNDFVGADIAKGTTSDIVLRDPRRFKVLNPSQVDTANNGFIANQIIGAGIEVPEIVRGYPNIYDLSASELGKVTVIITFGSDPATEDNLDIAQYGTSVASNRSNANNDGNVVNSSVQDVTLDGQANGRGNAMFIINLPYDVAAQLDKIIDGIADGQKGKLVCVGSYGKPLDIDASHKWGDFLNSSVTDINVSVNCGGPFKWGDGASNKYVTAIYKVGI